MLSVESSSSILRRFGHVSKTIFLIFSYNRFDILKSPFPASWDAPPQTTLAHIAAAHCGYRSVEINASDDRSPEVLRERIARASQNATLDSATMAGTDTGTGMRGSRPNCIIIDEIDGVDGSRNALDCIISIIKAPLQQGGDGHKKASSSSSKNRSSSSSGVFPLTRPLICICNDQFAPALRELRRLAEVFVFSAPSEMRLVQRLRQICSKEGLQLASSTGAVAELCAATGFDIRSSINNLQFAALKSLQEVRSTGAGPGPGAPLSGTGSVDIGTVLQRMIRNGLKDDNLDLFQLWRQIFSSSSSSSFQPSSSSDEIESGSMQSLPPSLSGSGNTSSHSSSNSTSNANSRHRRNGAEDPSMRIMYAVSSYGDTQQVILGIFENMHSFNQHEQNFNKNSTCAEALSYADELQGFTFRGRDGFQVSGYIPLLAGVVRCYCAVAKKVSLQWPRKVNC